MSFLEKEMPVAVNSILKTFGIYQYSIQEQFGNIDWSKEIECKFSNPILLVLLTPFVKKNQFYFAKAVEQNLTGYS